MRVWPSSPSLTRHSRRTTPTASRRTLDPRRALRAPRRPGEAAGVAGARRDQQLGRSRLASGREYLQTYGLVVRRCGGRSARGSRTLAARHSGEAARGQHVRAPARKSLRRHGWGQRELRVGSRAALRRLLADLHAGPGLTAGFDICPMARQTERPSCRPARSTRWLCTSRGIGASGATGLPILSPLMPLAEIDGRASPAHLPHA